MVRTEKRASVARSKVRAMPKRTLPRIAAPVGLYMLAIGSGVLLSKPLAWCLVVLATVMLLLVGASYERAQRHLPDLGGLPFAVDPGLKGGVSKKETHAFPGHGAPSPPPAAAWPAPSLSGGQVLMRPVEQAKPLSQSE